MKIKDIKCVRIPAVIGMMILALSLWASPATAAAITDLPDLSLVDDYAVFGSNVNLSNVAVNGNIGVLANGKFTLMAPSSVNGDLYLGANVKTRLDNQNYETIYQPVDLSALANQVVTASTKLTALIPDLTYANWASPLTISGNGGVNVIDVTNVNLSSESVTLTGGASDYFLINVLGNFALGGSGGIVAGTGVDPSHIIINVAGTGSQITSHVNNIINGTMLVPYRSVNFHSLTGAVYGGTSDLQMTFMSGATINYEPYEPPAPVPEPATMLLLCSGLVGLAGFGKRKFKK